MEYINLFEVYDRLLAVDDEAAPSDDGT